MHCCWREIDGKYEKKDMKERWLSFRNMVARGILEAILEGCVVKLIALSFIGKLGEISRTNSSFRMGHH